MPDDRFGPWDVPRPVWAERGGHWHRGRLRMWRPSPSVLPGTTEGLAGLVDYSVGAGLQHHEWVPAARLKPGSDDDPNVDDGGDVAAPWLGDGS